MGMNSEARGEADLGLSGGSKPHRMNLKERDSPFSLSFFAKKSPSRQLTESISQVINMKHKHTNKQVNVKHRPVDGAPPRPPNFNVGKIRRRTCEIDSATRALIS